MLSAAPIPSNDYKWDPAPAQAKITRLIWDKVMGGTDPAALGIGPRLRALEDVNTGIEQIQAELEQFGLERLDEAIIPLINDTQASIVVLQQQVADTVAQNGQIIEDFQEQIDAAIASLQADINDLQEQVDIILAGGIPAANVSESGTRVFVTPAQKAEIGQLRTDLTAETAARTSAISGITFNTLRPLTIVTAATANAVASGRYRCQTAANNIAITLPASPAEDDTIDIERDGATNTVTIMRNGKVIAGFAADFVLDADRYGVTLTFCGGVWGARGYGFVP